MGDNITGDQYICPSALGAVFILPQSYFFAQRANHTAGTASPGGSGRQDGV